MGWDYEFKYLRKYKGYGEDMERLNEDEKGYLLRIEKLDEMEEIWRKYERK